MADALVRILLGKLVDRLANEGQQLIEVDDRFEEMKEELIVIQSFVRDAEKVKRNERNESLKTVINKLKELLYDAEDFIADFQLHIRKEHRGEHQPQCTRYCSPSFLTFRWQLSGRLQKILVRIRNIKQEISFLGTSLNLPRQETKGENLPVNYPFLLDPAEIVGLEDYSNKIKEWVMEASGLLTVIGIVGMGGLGKTTLAQKISNEEWVNGSFKYVLMITDCRSKTLEVMVKKMLRKLRVRGEIMRSGEVVELLEEVKSLLDEQKYLIILDNVWSINEEQWWERLRDVLPQTDGSCVVVTTRNANVARSMGAVEGHILRLQFLSENDSWSLFSKVAFQRSRGVCTDQDLIDIGKEIVRKCNGLPLTIKVVGGMMQAKQHSVSEWRRISNHLYEELATNNIDASVTSSLQLSYEDLPSYLKPCLLSFSFFHDYDEYQPDSLTKLWIGEGFVSEKNGKLANDIGNEYIVELSSRCLIQVEDMDVFEQEIACLSIHDMVKDMVTKIAKEENFIEFDNRGSPKITNKSRRGLILNSNQMECLKTDSKLRVLVGGSTEAALRKSFQLKWLRVLDLFLPTSNNGKIPNKDLLGGIGSLPHLIVLTIQIHELQELPNSIGKLTELQILDLLHCSSLKRLPSQITTLEKLTVLNMEGCNSLEYIPKAIGELPNLQQLLGFEPASSRYKDKGCRVADLKNLAQLTKLTIEIESEDHIEEGELNVLSKLQRLKFLAIGISGSRKRNEFARKIDLPLSPLQNLQTLVFSGFEGEIIPTWINPTILPKLTFVGIAGANLRQLSDEFWGSEDAIWKLEVIVLVDVTNGAELFPKVQAAMPHLRLIKVKVATGGKLFLVCKKGEGGDWDIQNPE